MKEIPFKISYSQYKNALMDDRKILVTALCEVRQGASLLMEKDILLQDPFLTIKVKSSLCVSRETCWEEATRILHTIYSSWEGMCKVKSYVRVIWSCCSSNKPRDTSEMKHAIEKQTSPRHCCALMFLTVLGDMAVINVSVSWGLQGKTVSRETDKDRKI